MYKMRLFVLSIFSMFSPLYAGENTPVKPLEIGIVPYVGARALVASYEPLRNHLEQSLGWQVKIFTAPAC